MREDMAKVIVERPRYAGYCHSPNRSAWRQIDWDEQSSSIGKLRQWRHRKTLSENLRPFFRFLNSNVGRPWDDVYSEIRARINVNSAVQYHIWQHLRDYVWPHAAKTWWSQRCEFCVDPETGLLKRNPDSSYWNRTKKRAPATVIHRGERGQFRRIDGIWKVLLFKPLPVDCERCWDAYFKCNVRRVGIKRLFETYGRAGVYTVAVLPVTAKQLKGLPR